MPSKWIGLIYYTVEKLIRKKKEKLKYFVTTFKSYTESFLNEYKNRDKIFLIYSFFYSHLASFNIIIRYSVSKDQNERIV